MVSLKLLEEHMTDCWSQVGPDTCAVDFGSPWTDGAVTHPLFEPVRQPLCGRDPVRVYSAMVALVQRFEECLLRVPLGPPHREPPAAASAASRVMKKSAAAVLG